MIPILTRVSWTNLSRDRAAQVMAFVVPIAFFSIFAVIFGGAGSGGTHRVKALLVDESHTAASEGLAKALAADSSLDVHTSWAPAGAGARAAAVPLTRARAEELVRAGDAPVAYVLPAGIDTSLSRFDGRGQKVLILSDPSDMVAPRMAEGLLQAATLTASRDAAAEFGGVTKAVPVADMMPARTELREVVGDKRRDNGMVAFYAAGIAVMFLMFGASAAGGALIEETESGTLERVLSSGTSMTAVLGSKWGYLVMLGVAQIVVMFAWGMVAFRLPLLAHLPGFAVMTLATAACTSAFGLVLATLARTRQQLQGLANMIVLSFSAVGGSMFPRFLMPEWMQKASLVCFNSWALDGYIKVFWRESSLLGLLPQVGVLAAWTVVFLFLARHFAKRWEAA